VRGHKAIADAFAGIGAGAHGGVDGAGLATHQHGDITAADELTTDQTHLGGLGHRVGRLDRGNQTTGFNHAQGNTGYFSH
jgi:hypothetical protein